MRRTLLATTALLLIDAGTQAIAQPVEFDWTGFYIGLHGGYGFGRDKNAFGTVIDNGDPDVPAEAGPYNHATKGALAGGQLGYNLDFDDWVVGLEGEFAWSGMGGKRTTAEDELPGGDPGTFTRFRSKNRWDGDIAARLGFVLGHSLIFAKGGWSWGDFRYAETHDDFPTTNSCKDCIRSFTNTRGGYLLGGGVEFAFADNLTAKLEYDYINYGSHRLPYPATDNDPALQSFRVKDTKNFVKFGINYLFNEPAAPPPPPPAPPPPPPPPPPPTKTFIVFFDFDKSNLTQEAQSVVSEAVKTAKSNGFVRVMVTGHTDTVGSDRYNQSLSERRAESVKDEMVREGMDGNSIAIAGKSFHDPLVPTGPGVREPQNRRAVIDLGAGAST